jgi:hypothetical protein
MAVRRCGLPLRAEAFLRLPADSLSPGASPGPGGQPGRGGEPGHVAAGLGDDDLGGALADAGDGDQPGDEGGERRGRLGDQGVQRGDRRRQVIIGIQVEPAHLAMARGEPPVAGHLQLVGLAAQHAQGQPGQPGRVPLAGDQRLDHRPPGLAQHVAGHRVDLDAGFSELKMIKVFPGQAVFEGHRPGG